MSNGPVTFFVDVSHHDKDRRGGPIDWSEVWPHDTTAPGAMVAKLTEGDPSGPYHYLDTYGVQAIGDARSAGGKVLGGYHCLSKGDAASIARQVDWFRRQLDAAGAGWGMADVEPFDELIRAGIVPTRDDVLRMNDRWAAVEERVLAWYIPQWFWDRDHRGYNLGSMDLRPLQGPLFASRYPGGAGSPQTIYDGFTAAQLADLWQAYGGRTPDVAQFTSTAIVAGVRPTDANALRGTFDQLAALLLGKKTPEVDMFAIQLTGADTTWWLSDGFVRRPLFDSYTVRQPLQSAGVAFVTVTPPSGMGAETYLTRVAGVPAGAVVTPPDGGGDVDLGAVEAAAAAGARAGAQAGLADGALHVTFAPAAG